VVSVGLGWMVAGRVLRKLRTIRATARSISASNLHARLALAGPDDELRELGDTFDALPAGWRRLSTLSATLSPTPRTNCAPRWPGSGDRSKSRLPTLSPLPPRCRISAPECSQRAARRLARGPCKFPVQGDLERHLTDQRPSPQPTTGPERR